MLKQEMSFHAMTWVCSSCGVENDQTQLWSMLCGIDSSSELELHWIPYVALARIRPCFVFSPGRIWLSDMRPGHISAYFSSDIIQQVQISHCFSFTKLQCI